MEQITDRLAESLALREKLRRRRKEENRKCDVIMLLALVCALHWGMMLGFMWITLNTRDAWKKNIDMGCEITLLEYDHTKENSADGAVSFCLI